MSPRADRAAHARDDAEEAGGRHGLHLLGIVVGVLVLMALIRTFVVQTYVIPSGSMEDTLLKGDRVAVTMYDSTDITRGDVIVFRDPDHWLSVEDPTGWRGALQDVLIAIRILPEDAGHHLIKRVVGMPGDHVVSDGRGSLTVNGVALDESYVKAGRSASDIPFDVTVPDGCVWVMGDNRSNSADSRYHQSDSHGGAVPLSDVVGVAKEIVWPVSRISGLESGESAFADVPSASATASGASGMVPTATAATTAATLAGAPATGLRPRTVDAAVALPEGLRRLSPAA